MPLCTKTYEMAKGQERKVELPGVKPRAWAYCAKCSATELVECTWHHTTAKSLSALLYFT